MGLGLWGFDLDGIDALERAWDGVSDAQMLDPRVTPLILRLMVGRPSDRALKKTENFFASMGIDYSLCFDMLPGGRIGLVRLCVQVQLLLGWHRAALHYLTIFNLLCII